MKRERSDTHTSTAGDIYGELRVRDALQALDVSAPDTLRRAVELEVAGALERQRAPRRFDVFAGRGRRAPRAAVPRRLGMRPLALAGGALAAVALVLAFALSGSPAGPTVEQASRVALRPADAPAPAVRPGGDLLEASVDGITYPTWTRSGWRVVGERSDTLAGQRIRTVHYVDRNGGEVGYAIAAGDALPIAGGSIVHTRRGAQLRLLRVDGASVVTWQRDGHTCILASRHIAPARLLTLASYAT